MFLLLQFARKAQRRVDVQPLTSLVTPRKQDDKRPTALLEVDAIAGTAVDAHLGNTFTHGLDVSRMARGQTFDSCQDAGAGAYLPLLL